MNESKAVKSVLQHYLQRLQEAISRSPLLNATPSKLGSGSKLDLMDLERFGENTAIKLIDKVINRGSYKIFPRKLKYDLEDDVEEIERDQVRIFRQMERYLIRTADKIERETGNRSLWLGYPLLYLTNPSDRMKSVLAPIFLWPVRTRIDSSRPLCVEVVFDKQADAPSLNGILKAWIKTKWGFELSEYEIPTSRQDLANALANIFAELNDLQIEDVADNLHSIPKKKDIPSELSPRILNAGVIGVMRWQNQALMDDIQDLLDIDEFDASLPIFLTGQSTPSKKPAMYENEEDRHHVTEADYCQESAIIQARSTPGVIVHGPPGTGKSQTITNMVADSLARGENVLVVCQKKAAIDVVSSNLKAVGLSDVFVTVHDVVSDRGLVIDLLKDQLGRISGASSLRRSISTSLDGNNRRTELCKQIIDLESQLNSAHHQFHSSLPCGLSFSQIMGKLIKLGNKYNLETTTQSKIAKLFISCNKDDLNAAMKEIRVLGNLYEQCKPDKNPWQYRNNKFDLTPTTRRLFEEVIEICITESITHDDFCSNSGIGFEIDQPITEYLHQSKLVLNILGSILEHSDLKYLLSAYSNIHENETARSAYKNIIQLSRQIQKHPMDKRISSLYNCTDTDECLETIELIRASLTFEHKWLRITNSIYRSLKKRLRPKLIESGLAWTWDELRAIEATLCGYIDRERLDELLSIFSGPVTSSPLTDVERIGFAKRIEDWLQLCLKLKSAAKDLPLNVELHKFMCNSDIDELSMLGNQLEVAIKRCLLVQGCFQSFDKLAQFLTEKFCHCIKNSVCQGKTITGLLEQLRDSLETINQLNAYGNLYNQLNERDRNLIDILVKSQLGGYASDCSITDYWIAITELATYSEWRKEAISTSPILNTILEDSLRIIRKDLRDCLKAKLKAESDSLIEYWCQQSLDATDDNWKRLLRKRGVGSKRLREIVHRGHKLGIFKLRPCWLTNPETASQILPLEEGLFDLVIFDEASQLPLEQAAPSIYRAKRVVVAGDEHQLPPTSFFQTSSNVEDDAIPIGKDIEEDADAMSSSASSRRDGLELAFQSTDLLELSKYILPERLLNVHYRSRHPALIEFSNWAFYKGRLEAAHPTWGTETIESAPIRFHHVGGVYNQRTNLNEAKHIVKLLRHVWSQSLEVPTIGVVTFNKQQEDLIEEELFRCTVIDHEFRALMDRERERKNGAKDVGFFIKNLESVQGDERDIMIFSTTFGPTVPEDDSSFRRSFGPLTQKGGERRLNVAVTRARDAVIIVSSMPLDRISDIHNGLEPGRTIKARDYLQAYMLYAKAISDADSEGIKRRLAIAAKLDSSEHTDTHSGNIPEFDSDFEEQVYDRLIQAGWHVETQVGSRGFKIDLAVRHPDPSKGYLLGIECDGATYHSSYSARVHDIWREDILKQYGWNIYRIWSTHWWTFSDSIMDELCARLDSLCEPQEHKLDYLPTPTLTEVTAALTVDILSDTQLKDELEDATEQEVEVAPLFDANLSEWTKQFHSHLILSDHIEGEIATWHDQHNHIFEIIMARCHGTPMLLLQREGEEIGHFSIRNASTTVLLEASEELTNIISHADVLDWFGRLHRNLHPDIWS